MAVEFYIDNWLMASAAVGFARAYEEVEGKDAKRFFEGRLLKIPEDVWNKVGEIYADYIISISDIDGALSKENLKNLYNSVVKPKLAPFYNNSPLINPSTVSAYIKKLEEEKNINIKEMEKEEIKEKIKKVIVKIFSKKILNNESPEDAPTCFFCRNRSAYIDKGRYKTLDAKNFTPLSGSPDTMNNFFYNGKNNMYLCKECEALLYFAAFGFTKIDNSTYLFVYIPDDIGLMMSVNKIIAIEKRFGMDTLRNTFSRWILKNICTVKIEPVDKATSNIYTFSLTPSLAKALKDYEYPDNFDELFDIFLDYVYQGRSLYELLHYIIYGFVKKDKESQANKGYHGRLIMYGKKLKSLPNSLLYFIKFQEVLNMGEDMSKDIDKKVEEAYRKGAYLFKLYKESLGERALKRIEVLSYRLLDGVRKRDIDQICQNLIRAYLEVEKGVPKVFLDVLGEKGMERVMYAFIMGIASGLKGEGSQIYSGEDNKEEKSVAEEESEHT